MNVNRAQTLPAPLQQVGVSHHRMNAHSIEELPPENSMVRVQYGKHVRSSKCSALRLDCPDASEKIFTVNLDRKSTRLNSSHSQISYAVFCLKKKKNQHTTAHTVSRDDL